MLAQSSSALGCSVRRAPLARTIGIGSTPVSAMRPAKTETTDGHGGVERLGDAADLGEREERGDVELHAVGGEFLDEREAGFADGVGDGNLGVNVGCPRS